MFQKLKGFFLANSQATTETSIIELYDEAVKESGLELEDKRKLIDESILKDQAHTYIIGRTGTGKSCLLESMLMQDIEQGKTIILFDAVKGDLYDSILARLKKEKLDSEKWSLDQFREKVLVIDFDQKYTTPALNLLKPVSKDLLDIDSLVSLIKNNLYAYFKEEKAYGARIETTLDNALPVIIHNELSFEELLAFISPANDELREKLICHPSIPKRKRDFWRAFNKKTLFKKEEFLDSTLFKISPLVSKSVISNAFCSASRINLKKELQTKGKIILFNLSIGKYLSFREIKFIGSILFNQVLDIVFRTKGHSPNNPISIYADEFHKICNFDFGDATALLRSRKIKLVVAHQVIAQMEKELDHIGIALLKEIIANCKTRISFGIDSNSAGEIVNEFFQHFEHGFDTYNRPKNTKDMEAENKDRLSLLKDRETYYISHNLGMNKAQFGKTADIEILENNYIKESQKYLFSEVFNPKEYKYFISRKKARYLSDLRLEKLYEITDQDIENGFDIDQVITNSQSKKKAKVQKIESKDQEESLSEGKAFFEEF